MQRISRSDRSDNDPPASPRRIDLWVNRYTAIAALLTFLGTAIVSIPAAKRYIDSQVGALVAGRLRLYEEAAIGWNLNQSEDHDQAVLRFQAALNDPRFDGTPPTTKNLIRDGFILAASSTTRPVRYEADMKKVAQLFGGELEHTGWRHLQFGWYHLRSGNSSAARQHFIDARKYFDLDRERRVGADASRGLMYVALAEGRPDEALVFARDASSRNPAQYDLANLRNELRSMQDDGWIIDLRTLFPQTFAVSSDRLLQLTTSSE